MSNYIINIGSTVISSKKGAIKIPMLVDTAQTLLLAEAVATDLFKSTCACYNKPSGVWATVVHINSNEEVLSIIQAEYVIK